MPNKTYMNRTAACAFVGESFVNALDEVHAEFDRRDAANNLVWYRASIDAVDIAGNVGTLVVWYKQPLEKVTAADNLEVLEWTPDHWDFVN